MNDKGITYIADGVRAVSSLAKGDSLVFSGLTGSSKAFFLASLFKTSGRPILAVAPTLEDAETLESDLVFFLGQDNVFLFPLTEVLPFEGASPHPDITAKRIDILHRLSVGTANLVVVTPCQNLMERLNPKSAFTAGPLTLKKGAPCGHDGLIKRLSELGYSRVSLVEERGEASVRGGIVDVFPPSLPSPVRLEFLGDEIESMRLFDPDGQRSLKEIDEVRILPAGTFSIAEAEVRRARARLIERAEELECVRESWEPLSAALRDGRVQAGSAALLPFFYDRLGTLFDYLDARTIISVIEEDRVNAAFRESSASMDVAIKKRLEKRVFFPKPEDLYAAPDEVLGNLRAFPVVMLDAFKGRGRQVEVESNLDLRQGIRVRKGGDTRPLKPLAERILSWVSEGKTVYLSAHNKGQAERTRELLQDYGLDAPEVKSAGIIERNVYRGRGNLGLALAIGRLSSGFRLPCENLAVISEEEVFGERVRRRSPTGRVLDAFVSASDLSEGSVCVHKLHGIGVYRGIRRLTVDGVENDFLLIEYRDNDKLYLPVWRMDLVSSYHGAEGRTAALDKLGSQGWAKTKGRVRKAVEKMAGELLRLYAERKAASGFRFSKPDRQFQEFEAGFEYDETPDQSRAIADTLHDMQDAITMDRLICGDVGYGKTEVAMRAAFKAALDNKQTAVLVPTTVLAQQHYLTFSKRLAPFPVTVEVLSRFRSKKEQQETVERAKQGKVDILIGTHRLLQRDVEFKDLGLIVIDEEHRFGVRQKERFKELKRSVDSLTLTATPIPRTLHMSLSGTRDLSVINTPPHDRLAVKTSVVRFDEGLIKEAMERELNRGGQVFFVHNRIESMAALAEFIRRVMPEGRLAVAHGRMKEAELEKTMMGFVSRDYDILLSTAIIESGLDIPSANTIIINRADRFGLADLYQLRGRVGRSSHRAYAYLICPDAADLTPDARRRIEAVQELSEPGSGFRIASYDLEIRGAGELLGVSQSGHIADVGFEMYTELLTEAVNDLKGQPDERPLQPEINLRVSQYIPDEYMPDTAQRLGFYRRLACAIDDDELDSIRDELIDRYGSLPPELKNLMETMELRLLLAALKAKELSQKGNRLYITFGDYKGPLSTLGACIAEKALFLVKKEPERYRLMPDSRLAVLMPHGAAPGREARYVLKEIASGCNIE